MDHFLYDTKPDYPEWLTSWKDVHRYEHEVPEGVSLESFCRFWDHDLERMNATFACLPHVDQVSHYRQDALEKGLDPDRVSECDMAGEDEAVMEEFYEKREELFLGFKNWLRYEDGFQPDSPSEIHQRLLNGVSDRLHLFERTLQQRLRLAMGLPIDEKLPIRYIYDDFLQSRGPGIRGNRCPICHDKIASSDPSITHTTACKNTFCQPCLDSWIRTNLHDEPSCPSCRAPLIVSKMTTLLQATPCLLDGAEEWEESLPSTTTARPPTTAKLTTIGGGAGTWSWDADACFFYASRAEPEVEAAYFERARPEVKAVYFERLRQAKEEVRKEEKEAQQDTAK